MVISKSTFGNMILGVVATFVFAVAGNMAYAKEDFDYAGSLCIMADDFGDLQKARLQVRAIGDGEYDDDKYIENDHDGWLDTGVDLVEGADLQIKSLGGVDLCKGVDDISFSTAPSVKDGSWQDTGIAIPRGAAFKIDVVSGNFSKWSSDTSSCSSGQWLRSNNRVWSKGCWSKNGMGIAAYLGTSPPSDEWWGNYHSYGSQTAALKQIHSMELNNYSGVSPNYEGTRSAAKYNYDPKPADDSAIWGNSEELKLYLKYSDGVGGYGNNRGGYKVKVSFPLDCEGDEGEFLIGWVGDDPKGKNISPSGGGNVINLDPYSESTPSPGVFNGTAPAKGKLWMKIIDDASVSWKGTTGHGDNDYSGDSNNGFYVVNVTTKKPPHLGFSDLVNKMINPVRDLLRGTYDSTTGQYEGGLTKRMYTGITGNFNFVLAVRAAMALSIVFMAFHYMVGLSNITQKDLIIYIVKMSVVVVLIGPDSWEFFYKFLFTFFIEGVDDLIRITSSQFMHVIDVSGTGNGRGAPILTNSGDARVDTFAFVNLTLERFFSDETGSKLGALMAAFPLGFILGILIYVGIFVFIAALLLAVVSYLTAIIMVSLLLFMAPIFITFIMFEKTKGIFDSWLKQLMSYSLEPILLFTVLAIFNAFVFSAFYKLLSFDVCQQCLWELDLTISDIFRGKLGNFDKFCVFRGYMPWGVGGEQDPNVKLSKTPVGLFLVFIFIILCQAMYAFVAWVQSIAGALTAGSQAVGTGGAVKTGISEGVAGAKAVGNAAAKGGGAALATGDAIGAVLTGGRRNHMASDGLKRVGRKLVPRGRMANALLGGRTGRGASDGMGGKNRWSEKFMTSEEKKILDTKKGAFNRLSSEEKKQTIKDNEHEAIKHKNDSKEMTSSEKKADSKSRAKDRKNEREDLRANKRKATKKAWFGKGKPAPRSGVASPSNRNRNSGEDDSGS